MERVEKFEKMRNDALRLDSEYNDLPQLSCNDCGKISSFGGSRTFNVNIFVHADICVCRS